MGVYIQRVKMVTFTEADSFGRYASLNQFYKTIGDIKPTENNNTPIHACCSSYKVGDYNWVNEKNGYAFAPANMGEIRFRNTAYTNIEDFKQSMIGQTLIYELAKENHIPLSEIDPDALAQYVALHTNYPNTTVFNDAGAHMELKYVADTQKYVDKKFEALEAAIAKLI